MMFFSPKQPNNPNAAQDEFSPLVTLDAVFKRNDDPDPIAPTRRIHIKRLVALAVIVVLLPVLYFAVSYALGARLRRLAIEQAEQLDKAGSFDAAVGVMDTYMQVWPEDIQGLEVRARILTDGARNLDEVLWAADAQDLLLRIDPAGPGRQENRKKLVGLYIRYSDGIRILSTRLNISADKGQSRAQAAVNVAHQRISFGADDADAHQLLARALDCLAASGDATSLSEAAIEYERALRRDPHDVFSAERLAQIYHELGKDLAGSDEILDELLKAQPSSVPVRLARYRFFARTNRFDRAQVELDRATALAPTDLNVRLTAAGEALQRRETALARRHIEAVPAAKKDDQRVVIVRGLLALSEQNADAAIEEWSRGLRSTGGTDQDMTWRLAFMLLQVGRLADAKPLIAQYRRLASENDSMFQFLSGIWDEKTGRPWGAIAKIEKLRLSIDKVWMSEYLTTLGRCYEAINDDTRANLEYRRAIEASPRSLQPRQALARLLKKESADRAAQEIETALPLAPNDPSLYLDLALIRLDQQLMQPQSRRNWAQLNEVLERANKTGRPNPNLIKVKAEVLFSSGQYEEAARFLEQALDGPDRIRDDLWLFWSRKLVERDRVAEAFQVLERASAPDKAGDRASLRIARARLYVQTGKAQAARELLAEGIEKLPASERVELARGRAWVFHALGDNAGAREACREWAQLDPDEPDPGLALLEMSRKTGDDESANLGLELLQKASAEEEPSAMAAIALDLLLSNRKMADSGTSRFDRAEQLSDKLMNLAPGLPMTRLVRGIVMERNHRIAESVAEYRVALVGNSAEMALSRLILIYSKLKRFEDLALLKTNDNVSNSIDQLAANLAIELGEKQQAERIISQLADGQPDNVELRFTQASLFRKLGKPKEAEEVLRSLIDRGKDRPEAWVAMVNFQVDLGAKDEAAKTIERAAAEYKGDRPDLLTARLRWVAGDVAIAAKLYDEATARYPGDPTTLLAACNFAEATNRPDRVEALARTALKIRECSGWAARRLATLLSKRSDPAAWNEAWALVAPGGPGAGEAPGDRFLRASLLEVSPDPAPRAESLTVLTSLVADLPSTDPTAIRSGVKLATLLFQAGKPAEAARFILPATGETVQSDAANLALAIEILAQAGKPDEAEERLSRLAAIAPDSPQTVVSRAWVFQARGKTGDAIASIEDAAAASESVAEGEAKNVLFFNQLLVMKQLEAAERLGRKIARLWPKEAWIVARLFDIQGKTDEALDACQIAANAGATWEPLKLAVNLVMNKNLNTSQAGKASAVSQAIVAGRPKELGLLILASTLANRQGRFEDALKIYRQALETSPSNSICLNDMAWLLCEELDRPAEALVEIDKLFKVQVSATARDTRGVILTRLGRLDEAIAELERCVQEGPAVNRILHLARAYQMAGKVEQSQTTVDRAKKLGIKPANLSAKERKEFAALIGE